MTSHAPLTAPSLSGQTFRCSSPTHLSFLSCPFLSCLFFSCMHGCLLMPFSYVSIPPLFNLTCLCLLPVHLFNYLSPTIPPSLFARSASLKLAALILFGIPISIFPATILFILLLQLYHLSEIMQPCHSPVHPLSLGHSSLIYEL